VNAVRNYLRALQEHGLAVRFGVVFGSQATGKAGKWSDIDLLVVSPRFDGPRGRQDIDLLWRLAARSDSRIEPIPCGERQWQEDDSSPIIEVARREGEYIAL
jgi:predicted nucleotidyltransferase